MKQYGYKSSIKLMGYRQYVVEDDDTVRAVLKAAREKKGPDDNPTS